MCVSVCVSCYGVIMLSVIMLSFFMLSVIMLSCPMLSIFILSIMASYKSLRLSFSQTKCVRQGTLTEGEGSVLLTSLC